jgi:pimeloyl-ACP methyl ester carboxylesterase
MRRAAAARTVRSVSVQPKPARSGQRPAEEPPRERMLAGVPVTERRVQVAGVSTAVLEGGHGPPLVLLHGGIECGGAIWAPAISRLAEGHSLVVPDLPGLGESEPVARQDAGAFSEWFAELLRQTCAEKPALIAHSLAGHLAARFAADHGDLLRRLVIYAGSGIGPYRLPLRLMVIATRFSVRPTERNAERFDRFAVLDLDRIREQDPEWWDAFSGYTRSRAVVPHVKRTMRQLIKTCTKQVPDADLRRIAVPTALVWGRRDRMVPLSLGEGASARLGWPLHVVDDAAHVPHVEQPEEFLRALDAALTGSLAP